MNGFLILQLVQDAMPDKVVTAYTYPSDAVIVISVRWSKDQQAEKGPKDQQIEKWSVQLPFDMVEAAETEQQIADLILKRFDEAWRKAGEHVKQV